MTTIHTKRPGVVIKDNVSLRLTLTQELQELGFDPDRESHVWVLATSSDDGSKAILIERHIEK